MEDFFYFFSWSCHRKDYQVLEHTAERGGRVTIPGHVKKKGLDMVLGLVLNIVVVLGCQLYRVILEVFYNPDDSMTL